MRQLFLLTLGFLVFSSFAEANVLWPMFHIYGKTHIQLGPIIVGSILVEAVIVKWITKHPWGKSILLTCIVNLISAILGLVFAIGGGVALTSLITKIFTLEEFSLVDWISEILFYALASSLIEFQALRYLGRFKFFQYNIQGFKSKAYLAFLIINIVTAGAAAYQLYFHEGFDSL